MSSYFDVSILLPSKHNMLLVNKAECARDRWYHTRTTSHRSFSLYNTAVALGTETWVNLCVSFWWRWCRRGCRDRLTLSRFRFRSRLKSRFQFTLSICLCFSLSSYICCLIDLNRRVHVTLFLCTPSKYIDIYIITSRLCK